jgi:hypothetical protein
MFAKTHSFSPPMSSLASSTLVMGIYMVLIYRNYQKDLRQMYRGDFSFLPKNVRKNDNKILSGLTNNSSNNKGSDTCHVAVVITFVKTFTRLVSYKKQKIFTPRDKLDSSPAF